MFIVSENNLKGKLIIINNFENDEYDENVENFKYYIYCGLFCFNYFK